jgi:hypothetical protein
MSYPDEEKKLDYNEVFCGILGAVWFVSTITFIALIVYELIC